MPQSRPFPQSNRVCQAFRSLTIIVLPLTRIVCGNTKRADLPEEEAKIRQAEDKLFTDIAVPPSTSHTFMSLLGNGENDDNDEEGTGSSPEKEVLSSTPKSQPKKRGRPRKCK